MADFHLKAVFQ